jgi:hypothetical protein
MKKNRTYLLDERTISLIEMLARRQRRKLSAVVEMAVDHYAKDAGNGGPSASLPSTSHGAGGAVEKAAAGSRS